MNKTIKKTIEFPSGNTSRSIAAGNAACGPLSSAGRANIVASRSKLRTKKLPSDARFGLNMSFRLEHSSLPRREPQSVKPSINISIFSAVARRAEKTIVRYDGELKAFNAFCQGHGVQRVAQVTPSLADAYRADRLKTHHPRTVHHETMVIKSWLRWCENRQLISENPLRRYRVSKPISQPKPAPTLAEVQKILAVATPQRRLLFAVLAFTGMRVGDLRRLRQEDVDRCAGWFHIMSRPAQKRRPDSPGGFRSTPCCRNSSPATSAVRGRFSSAPNPAANIRQVAIRLATKNSTRSFNASPTSLAWRSAASPATRCMPCDGSLRRFASTPQCPSAQSTFGWAIGVTSRWAPFYYSLSDGESKAMMAKVPFLLDADTSEGNHQN